jgi:hypothetical protein
MHRIFRQSFGTAFRFEEKEEVGGARVDVYVLPAVAVLGCIASEGGVTER